jgi:hypothetical protein
MPIERAGVTYFKLTELAKALEVSRQTLWRWRQEDKIPLGHLYRGRQVLFSEEEAMRIREYANRIEPIDQTATRQLGLFNGRQLKEG